MRFKILLLVIGLAMILSAPGAVEAQLLPKIGPPIQELEALWNGFWEAIRAGDLKSATKYVYSRRRHVFPRQESLAALQEKARQMAYCRVDPTPLIFTMMTEEQIRRIPPTFLEALGIEEDLIYPVHCQHQGETAESAVGIRRDMDGVWRISAL